MKNLIVIAALMLAMVPFAADAQSRQQQAQDAVQANLPAGVTVETATQDQLMAAAESALQADDSLAPEVTDAVVSRFPAAAADVAATLSSVSPNNAGAITTSAATAAQLSGAPDAPNIQTISNRVKAAVPQTAAVVDNAVSNYSPPVVVPEVAVDDTVQDDDEPTPPDIVNPPTPGPANGGSAAQSNSAQNTTASSAEIAEQVKEVRDAAIARGFTEEQADQLADQASNNASSAVEAGNSVDRVTEAIQQAKETVEQSNPTDFDDVLAGIGDVVANPSPAGSAPII